MTYDNKISTATGTASEDADDRAEKIMQKSMGTRPGALAYAALAIFTAMAILGSIIAIQVSKDRATAAVEANCESVDASNRVLAEVINELTAPRILSASATPEQVAMQEEANRIAAENREAKLSELRTQECNELGDTTNPEVVPITEPPPPPVIVGSDGAIGASGITGPAGPVGAPGVNGVDGAPGVNGTDGSDGSDGVDGSDGSDGVDGVDGVDGSTGPEGPLGPTGPEGPAGPPGADAPTTTTMLPPPPPPDTTTTTMNPLCNLGLCPP